VESCFRSFFKNYDWIEAAGGIVKRNDCFLFIKRNGVWDLPKGKIESNEKPKKAAVREIHEECGIIAENIGELIIETYHVYEYKGKNTIKKTYWYDFEYDGKAKLVPQTEEGITKVEWLKRKQLKKVF
jgi:8-oxo-dGTP pyrophosphatase MutT (NUDIX family)